MLPRRRASSHMVILRPPRGHSAANHDYTIAACLQCCATLNGQHWSSVVISAALPCCTKSTTIWSTLISHPSLQRDSPVPEVMHLVSYNHSAAVLLTPTRSFLVLSGTGMHWRWILFQTVTSRTTSSLMRHLITSGFNLATFFIRQERGLPSRCAFVFSQEVTVNGR